MNSSGYLEDITYHKQPHLLCIKGIKLITEHSIWSVPLLAGNLIYELMLIASVNIRQLLYLYMLINFTQITPYAIRLKYSYNRETVLCCGLNIS